MKIKLRNLLDLIIYKPSKDKENFTLEETEREQEQNKDENDDQAVTSGEETGGKKHAPEEQKFRIPQRPGRVKDNKGKKDSGENKKDFGEIFNRLELNKEKIKEIYDISTNKDFIIREFYLGLEEPVKAFVLYMEGMSDKNVINMAVLQPLMLLTRIDGLERRGSLVDFIKEQLLPGNQVENHNKFKEVVNAVNFGSTAIFIDGCSEAIVVETKGFEHRTISTPMAEQVIRGPHEAFAESLRPNIALVRKQLRTHELNTEMFKLGSLNNVDMAMLYVRSIANPELVKEVKRRIQSIKADFINDTGILEQFIEDHPYSVVPQVISTERPDRVSYFLSEGRIALFVDGSPNALVVPGTLFEQLHTPEDTYLRPTHGTALRIVRTIAFYIAFLLPGIYLSIVLFHQEMIPTDLLLSISGARERVPFPSLVEVLLMEFSFELIREAGTRIPGVLGTTIGIVGALVLGQAAVEANIVSPILIIVTAITALSAFAVPNYSLQFSLRLARFLYILLGAFLGFFGLTLGLFYQISLMSNQKSFGVPYIAPAAPQTKGGRGSLIRNFLWNKEKRPDYLQTNDIKKQPNISRGWVKEDQANEADK